MTLVAALLFYFVCGMALTTSLQHPWPGSSLLTMLSLLAMLNCGYMLEEGFDEVLRFFPKRLGRFWRDSMAPPEWHDSLLKARDLAAEWYRREYMPLMPESLRLVLEWGLWVVGGAGLLVLIYRAGVYPYEGPSPLTAGDISRATSIVLVATAGVYTLWFIAGLLGRGWLAWQKRPRDVIGEALPPPDPSEDDNDNARIMAQVIDLLAPPDSARGLFFGFNGMGYRLSASCPVYTGPTARPARMLRDVAARFGWFWLVAAAALLLSLLAPGHLATHWVAHIVRALEWSLAAAYAYFLYLSLQALRIRHQAKRPWKYSPGGFAPLWHLVAEASSLRDRGLVVPEGSPPPWVKKLSGHSADNAGH